jgi:hypothetical protein
MTSIECQYRQLIQSPSSRERVRMGWNSFIVCVALLVQCAPAWKQVTRTPMTDQSR